MLDRLAAARQIGPRIIAGRLLWRLRQAWRWLQYVLVIAHRQQDFTHQANLVLDDLPIRTFLPEFGNIDTLSFGEGRSADAYLARLREVGQDVVANTYTARGIGTVRLRFEDRNWYAYEPAAAIMINRHDFLLPLVQNYILTRDAIYSAKLKELFDYWIDNFDSTTLRESDTPIDVAIRLINWAWVLNTDVLELTRERRAGFLRIIYAQLEYIYIYHSAGGNHLVLEALAHYVFGSVFADSRRGRHWQLWGRRCLLKELDRQVTSDGVHTEQSMFYHQAVCTHYLKFFQTAETNGDELPGTSKTRFLAMLDYVHASAKPSLTHPVVGDGEALVTEDREHWEARSLLAARWSMFGKPLFKKFLPMVDFSSVWMLACPTGKIATTHDEPPSEILKASGIAILRSDDAYVFIDAAPFSDPEVPHHGHADSLSFELCARGKDLFVDPGGYGYYDDEFRTFFRSTMAHNTVTVDDTSQSELFGVFGYGRLARSELAAVELGDRIDRLSGWHDGYHPSEHWRDFFLVKDTIQFLLIVDRLKSVRGRSVVSRYHAAPGVTVDLANQNIVEPASHMSFGFSCVSNVGLRHRVVKGIRDSVVQGWIAPETGKVLAAETWEIEPAGHDNPIIANVFALQEDVPVHAALEDDSRIKVSVGEARYEVLLQGDQVRLQPK